MCSPPQLYEPGVYKLSEGMDSEEASRDGHIYFEDAIWRPSFIGDVYNGKYEDFNRADATVDEVAHLRDLAERYEESLAMSMSGDEEEAGGRESGKFNPEVFDMEEEEEGEERGEDGKERE